jgi:hypothetical protein
VKAGIPGPVELWPAFYLFDFFGQLSFVGMGLGFDRPKEVLTR